MDRIAPARSHPAQVTRHETGAFGHRQEKIVRAQVREDCVVRLRVVRSAFRLVGRVEEHRARRVDPARVEFPLGELERIGGEAAAGQGDRALAQFDGLRIPAFLGEHVAGSLPEKRARLHFSREELRTHARCRTAARGQKIFQHLYELGAPVATPGLFVIPAPARQRRIVFHPQTGQQENFLRTVDFVGSEGLSHEAASSDTASGCPA